MSQMSRRTGGQSVDAKSGGNPRFARAQEEAINKARNLGTWKEVLFYPGEGIWTVPSNGHPNMRYTIDRGNPHSPDEAWWLRLRCECPADEHGLSVCYHKAAVYYRLKMQRREQDTYAQEYIPPRRPANGAAWPSAGGGQPDSESGESELGPHDEDLGSEADLPEPQDDMGGNQPKGDPD